MRATPSMDRKQRQFVSFCFHSRTVSHQQYRFHFRTHEKMKGPITAIIALALATSAAAFAPATPFVAKPTALCAEAEKKELVLDANFDDVNVVKLLGLQRVKKMIRKNKRVAAQKEE